MIDNFYIVTDMDGKMPMLCRGTPSHPGMPKMAWVKYVSDRPVEAKPYNGQDTVCRLLSAGISRLARR